jgi:carboxymethylenebutenolidase
VIEQPLEISTHDGIADGYFYHQPETGPRPGIIYLTDIGGIRDATRAMARRLAESGYSVLLPNAFYRTAKPPLFDYVPNFREERTLKRFAELAKPLTPEAVVRDAAAYVAALRGREEVARGPLAAVGFCFTGAVALRMAAAQPDDIAAVASFHGGGLYTDAPTSPHLVLPNVRARLYFAHADNDGSMNEQAIAKLDHALEAWGGTYESELYPGAAHGWTVPGGAVYHHEQAERAFEKLTALLGETLPKT